MKTAKYWIEKLKLEKHPEGGWFKEVYRSAELVPEKCLHESFSGPRNLSTSIYYLLEGNDFSAFHRIKSDEIWHYYAGNSPIEIVSIENGACKTQLIGSQPDENQCFQHVVPRNTWFAARLPSGNGFALVGCTVSPGFHFNDFTMAEEDLVLKYPELELQIRSLIRF